MASLAPDELLEANRIDVFQCLKNTVYAAASIEPLAGGQANFTYHVRLEQALCHRDDATTAITDVLVKRGAPYMAKHPQNGLTTDRCDVEVVCMKELESLQEQWVASNATRFIVRTPKCLFYEAETKTQVHEYIPRVLDLRTYSLKLFRLQTTASLRPQCRELGKALAGYIARFHSLGAIPPGNGAESKGRSDIWSAVTQSDDMQKLKHMINYDWLLDRVDQFPEVLQDAREVFVQVKQRALDELERGSKNLTVIHGDFYPQNILLQAEPLSVGCLTPLYVVDWENAQLGLPAMDHGGMMGEMYVLWLCHGIEAGLWMMQGYAKGLATLPEETKWRVAVQIGVHILSFWTFGREGPVGEFARQGRDIVANAWGKNRAWFETSELSCLFLGTS
ncbi:4-hydroxytryptamine kinase [Colletotrichum sidae]|uniref:4-hydroxytryptamine kinase n=1 Tax=Colletotrichum sidae TaxID=1347389 RepID=A0A4R8SS33_9PEZI|nr:4-hydroxytryptamine kinase [Colletotrichum sidae]